MPVVVRSVIDCQCRWERTREVFAGIFIQKSQKEWCAVFDGTDACVTPVLRPEQLHEHPLHMARLGRLQNADTPQPPKQYLTLRPCRGTYVQCTAFVNRLTEQFATVIGRVSARLNRRADAIARSMRRARGHSAKSPATPRPSSVHVDSVANPLYSPFFDSAAPAADASSE